MDPSSNTCHYHHSSLPFPLPPIPQLMMIWLCYELRSLESVLHIEAEFADAFTNIIEGTMRVLLLEEEMGMYGVDDDFD